MHQNSRENTREIISMEEYLEKRQLIRKREMSKEIDSDRNAVLRLESLLLV